MAIDKLTTVIKKPPAKPKSADDETSEDEEPNKTTSRKEVKTKKPSPSSLQPSISSLEPGAIVKDTFYERVVAIEKLTTGTKKPPANPEPADDETSKGEEPNETTARNSIIYSYFFSCSLVEDKRKNQLIGPIDKACKRLTAGRQT